MKIKKVGMTITADIHGMTEEDAKKSLERLITLTDESVTEIVVIHGYQSGRVLRDMVRGRLKHRKIKQKILSMNDGETTLLLK